MIRRRWVLAAGAGGLVFLGFILYAYGATPIYEATATIYVERPLIPDATAAAYPEEQLIAVTQRVLATQNVSNIIAKHELYPAIREMAPIEDLVLTFRDNTSVTPSVVDAPTDRGRTTAMTYAFTVAFRYDNAEKASAVANELARQHVTENSALRSGSAARTSEFLQAEAEKVSQGIAEVQAKIAAILRQSGGVLAAEDPMQAATRYEQIDRELAATDASLRAARERKDVLESEALQTPQYRAVMTDGQTVMRGEDRLIVAQQELIALQARYSDDHPDIVRLKREIAALSGGPSDNRLIASQLQASIAATEQQLATARESYSEDHPDVARLRRNLETQQRQLADVTSRGASQAAPAPDNPLYLQLQTRIRTAEIEINELSSRRSALYGRLTQYSYNPELEAKYRPLARERDLLQQQYEDLRARYTQATLAKSVESDDQGQFLTFAEPARVPGSPVEPNRPILMLLGFLLGIGAAFGSAFMADLVDPTIRGSRDIEALLRQTPLAIIPIIASPADVVHQRKARIQYALIALTLIVIVAIVMA
jgi:polysaccharide biosynthesis transport protein